MVRQAESFRPRVVFGHRRKEPGDCFDLERRSLVLPRPELVDPRRSAWLDIAPGVAVAAVVAALGYLVASLIAPIVPVPAMVTALIIGIALNPIAARPSTNPGTKFCVHTVLRWAVALMGLRIGLSDIAVLGAPAAILIIAAMAITIVSGFLFARWYGQTPEFGALVGVGTGVCGASATLAVSTVLPNYPGKQADIAFTVVAVNAFATLAMVIYPPICIVLDFDPQITGIMLGGTIHDVAQVAGAGYAISSAVGNAAIIVKLFRVFLLLPIVLCVGSYFNRRGGLQAEARVAVPLFAIVFLILCALNSTISMFPSVVPEYSEARDLLVSASNWGLLLAIGALGLSTSVKQVLGLGWRHIGTAAATTFVILATVTAGLLFIQY